MFIVGWLPDTAGKVMKSREERDHAPQNFSPRGAYPGRGPVETGGREQAASAGPKAIGATSSMHSPGF